MKQTKMRGLTDAELHRRFDLVQQAVNRHAEILNALITRLKEVGVIPTVVHDEVVIDATESAAVAEEFLSTDPGSVVEVPKAWSATAQEPQA